MQEICKSGSVRGIEVFSYGSNIVTLRKPKGRRNREYKINLKEKTILCLLDVKREVRRQESGDRMGGRSSQNILHRHVQIVQNDLEARKVESLSRQSVLSV